MKKIFILGALMIIAIALTSTSNSKTTIALQQPSEQIGDFTADKDFIALIGKEWIWTCGAKDPEGNSICNGTGFCGCNQSMCRVTCDKCTYWLKSSDWRRGPC